MGLDTVELVIEVEKRFGITIGDQEAQDTVTVGDLTRLVLSKFDLRNLHVCPTLRAFLGLRSDIRELMADTGLRVRPRQRIDRRLVRR